MVPLGFVLGAAHMRVKTDAKRRAILAAAAEVFRESGFAGATMAAVSERAGASKATVYRYFNSKDDLFVTLMMEAVLEHANRVFDTLRPSDDLRQTLERFGARLLALNLSDEALSVRRNSIAEGSKSNLARPCSIVAPCCGRRWRISWPARWRRAG
jgi:AcrR family transcriptional regulator